MSSHSNVDVPVVVGNTWMIDNDTDPRTVVACGTGHEGGGVREGGCVSSRMQWRRHLYASATGSQLFFFLMTGKPWPALRGRPLARAHVRTDQSLVYDAESAQPIGENLANQRRDRSG